MGKPGFSHDSLSICFRCSFAKVTLYGPYWMLCDAKKEKKRKENCFTFRSIVSPNEENNRIESPLPHYTTCRLDFRNIGLTGNQKSRLLLIILSSSYFQYA